MAWLRLSLFACAGTGVRPHAYAYGGTSHYSICP